MAKTKLGKWKAHLKRCEAKHKTGLPHEAERPRMGRSVEHTVTTKNKETGEVVKNRVTIFIVDNTYGRRDRREDLMKALRALIKGEQKKPRMKGFAHKKDRAAERKMAKQNAKQGKGKKGKGGGE